MEEASPAPGGRRGGGCPANFAQRAEEAPRGGSGVLVAWRRVCALPLALPLVPARSSSLIQCTPVPRRYAL